MKKLHFIATACLAGCLLAGCGEEDTNAVALELEDKVLEVPANDGGGPSKVVDPSAPPPIPEAPPVPGTGAPKKNEDAGMAEIPAEKVEASVNASKAQEGDAGLIYAIQQAVEGYYEVNKSLPPDISELVKSGFLATYPIAPKGKKIRINGKTLEVTIEGASEEDAE